MMSRDLELVFMPSVREIEEYEGNSSYFCGLEVFRLSVDGVFNEAVSDWRKEDDGSDPHWSSPHLTYKIDTEFIANYSPDLLHNLLITVTSSGMGIAVYRIIRLWIESVNGRRIFVKLPTGLTLEATRLSHKDFSKLLSDIKEFESGETSDGRSELIYKRLKEAAASEEEMREATNQLADARHIKQQDILSRASRYTESERP